MCERYDAVFVLFMAIETDEGHIRCVVVVLVKDLGIHCRYEDLSSIAPGR